LDPLIFGISLVIAVIQWTIGTNADWMAPVQETQHPMI
jgi:uncharacterized membrane protein